MFTFYPTPVWHGKLFRFSWDLPNAWWVWIYFHNGERKPWYRRTERSYRFRRWFFRRSQGTFRNIAHSDFPSITLYIFPQYSIFPKKQVIQLQVHRLDIPQLSLAVFNPDALTRIPELVLDKPNVRLQVPETRIRKPYLNRTFIPEPLLKLPDEPDFTLPL